MIDIQKVFMKSQIIAIERLGDCQYDSPLNNNPHVKFIDDADFRYRGPKPQTREAALVMLADGCEAAVRSGRPLNREESARIINTVIDQRVADGQLSECDLTLQDLEAVRAVFVSTLRGIYHPRIRYPKVDRPALQQGQGVTEHVDA